MKEEKARPVDGKRASKRKTSRPRQHRPFTETFKVDRVARLVPSYWNYVLQESWKPSVEVRRLLVSVLKKHALGLKVQASTLAVLLESAELYCNEFLADSLFAALVDGKKAPELKYIELAKMARNMHAVRRP